ncbi:MAG: hypothetical protein J1F12_08285 [Muribaculaceae bacterium]|nr:hypothetical protein [Muribaculaceae bacterium]
MRSTISLFGAIIITGASALLLSCGEKTEKIDKEEYDKVLAQKDSCELELNTLNGYLGEISECVDSIAIQEGVLLNVVNVETGQPYSRKEVKERIQEFGSIIERQKAKIQELSAKLEKSSADSKEIARLSAMVSFLNKQLEEKENQIAQLQIELETSKRSITELTANVETLTTNNMELSSQNRQLDQIVADQTEQMNEGYFLAADKKKLESLGLLKGGFLKKTTFNAGNISLSDCMKVDIRKFNNVKLKSKKKPDLLTQAPIGSYNFEKTGDGEYTFEIVDSHAFWSISNVVIIKLN